MNKIKLSVHQVAISAPFDGGCAITLHIKQKPSDEVLQSILDTIQNGKVIDATLNKHVKHRSVDSNSYMWTLIGQLAIILNTSREELYQGYIKKYGVSQMMLIKNDCVSESIERWNRTSLGTFAEILQESKKNKGSTIVVFYFGSSTYSNIEMSRVIEQVVLDCEENGIATVTENELAKMIGAKNG